MQTNKKIYCLFKPYAYYEVGLRKEEVTKVYPDDCRKMSFYSSEAELINAYANTMCPASQMIKAKDEADFKKKLAMWNKRYDSEAWLEKHLYPYL